MEDRFKFRCFDKENKCMHYPTRYSNFSIVNGVIVKIESYLTGNGVYRGKRVAYEFDDAILMQCTGLKDKNGKLIYEGDIVERKNGFSIKRGVVYFNEVFTQFDATNMSHYSLVNRSIVLGNIYQNPELLEE